MSAFVVDTNVAVAANGRDTHADEACQFACVEFLLAATTGRGSVVVLDDEELIFGEYERHLNYHGQPGVGDIFFKYLHDNKWSGGRVRLATIHRNEDPATGFDELPENALDLSDRKFLAVAVVSKATVINAVDTDWFEQDALLKELKVSIQQLCPQHGCVAD